MSLVSARETFIKRYAGFFLLLCMVVGGGKSVGLTSDFILQIAAIPIVYIALFDRDTNYSRFVVGLVVAVIGVQFIQILPRLWEGAGFTLLTRDIGTSIDGLAFTSVLACFFLALGKLSHRSLERLIPFVLLGLAINVALAFAQFSSSTRLATSLFPYELKGGFYANENHFSALLFACIPILIAWFWVRRRLSIAIGCVMVLIFLEFVAGSTAGILLSMACAAVTLWALRDGERSGVGSYIMLAVAAALVLLAFNLERIVGTEISRSIGEGSARQAYVINTLQAIWAYLPFGSGFGTFPLIYPEFEPVSQVDYSYVNHAHNEYLELLLEGGLLAAALIVGYFAVLTLGYSNARRSKLKMGALCGLGFLLIHSLVDFPLRTMGVASVFVLLNALYFSRRGQEREAQYGAHYLARRSPNLLAPS